MCKRKFGIGADGLILLEDRPTADFRMVYFNADGNEGSMCGNGGRCAARFAQRLGMAGAQTEFEAVDGLHRATIDGGSVSLKMNDVPNVTQTATHCFLDTGSPHHVQMVSRLNEFEVIGNGRGIRNKTYGAAGANINFVEKISDSTFSVRTYERGVENETLSCGTGATAVALAMYRSGQTISKKVTVQTPGGNLKVTFGTAENGFTDIYLTGPATHVFEGLWNTAAYV